VVICWKDDSASARAVAAAMPLLAPAREVAVVSVPETRNAGEDGLKAVVDQLAWHGIMASSTLLRPDGRRAEELLLSHARSVGAALLVMGGYGKHHLREVCLGWLHANHTHGLRYACPLFPLSA
jgi:nucleotide-binding universal stress UspA family protein